VSRPTLHTFMRTRSDLDRSTQEFFDLLQDGRIRLRIEDRIPLVEAERAHRMLESRAMTGALVLKP